jgi:hypothetical protein
MGDSAAPTTVATSHRDERETTERKRNDWASPAGVAIARKTGTKRLRGGLTS